MKARHTTSSNAAPGFMSTAMDAVRAATPMTTMALALGTSGAGLMLDHTAMAAAGSAVSAIGFGMQYRRATRDRRMARRERVQQRRDITQLQHQISQLNRELAAAAMRYALTERTALGSLSAAAPATPARLTLSRCAAAAVAAAQPAPMRATPAPAPATTAQLRVTASQSDQGQPTSMPVPILTANYYGVQSTIEVGSVLGSEQIPNCDNDISVASAQPATAEAPEPTTMQLSFARIQAHAPQPDAPVTQPTTVEPSQAAAAELGWMLPPSQRPPATPITGINVAEQIIQLPPTESETQTGIDSAAFAVLRVPPGPSEMLSQANGHIKMPPLSMMAALTPALPQTVSEDNIFQAPQRRCVTRLAESPQRQARIRQAAAAMRVEVPASPFFTPGSFAAADTAVPDTVRTPLTATRR